MPNFVYPHVLINAKNRIEIQRDTYARKLSLCYLVPSKRTRKYWADSRLRRLRHRQIETLSTSGRLFAHSTLRNPDDISGINGSSQLRIDLKNWNFSMQPPSTPRYVEWRPRGFIAPQFYCGRRFSSVNFRKNGTELMIKQVMPFARLLLHLWKRSHHFWKIIGSFQPCAVNHNRVISSILLFT